MGGKPIPKPCFLDECVPVKGKRRWRSQDMMRFYEWDAFHGEIEVYDSRGNHLGVLNPQGDFKKGPIKGRKIDV